MPIRAEEYVSPAFRVLDVSVDVNWEGKSLGELVEWMRSTVGWNVVVRWNALSKIQITKLSEIDIHLTNVSVQVILDETLLYLSPQLTYHLKEHVLIISTRENFNTKKFVRLYNVAELVLATEIEKTPPANNLKAMTQTVTKANEFSFDNNQQDFNNDIQKELVQAIMMIEPETWKSNGGNGTINWIDNMLIVNSTREIHEQIEKYFKGD